MIPADLQVVSLTIGPLYSVDSDPIQNVPITVTLATNVRITDSGTYLPSTETVYTGVMGMATVHLVATDSTGIDVTGFTYNVVVPGLTAVNGIDIALPSAVPSVRIEDLVGVEPSPGVNIWVPAQITDALMDVVINDGTSATRASIQNLVGGGGGVMSVDARVGNVTLGDLYAPVAALDGKASTTHATTHAQGGSDSIDAAALASGAAPSGYVPAADGSGGINWAAVGTTAHGSNHYQGGTDALDVGNLGSGAATAGQVPTADGTGGVDWSASGAGAHASSHYQGGADALDVAALGSGAAIDGYVATADGAGGVDWAATVLENDPRFQEGQVEQVVVYDTTGGDWPAVGAKPSWAYARLWRSTNAVGAAPPPAPGEEDRWLRAKGAVWPLP